MIAARFSWISRHLRGSSVVGRAAPRPTALLAAIRATDATRSTVLPSAIPAVRRSEERNVLCDLAATQPSGLLQT